MAYLQADLVTMEISTDMFADSEEALRVHCSNTHHREVIVDMVDQCPVCQISCNSLKAFCNAVSADDEHT